MFFYQLKASIKERALIDVFFLLEVNSRKNNVKSGISLSGSKYLSNVVDIVTI